MTTDDDTAVPAAAERSRRPAPPGPMDVTEDEWDPSNGPRPLRGRMSRLAIASFVPGLLGGLLGPIFGVVALLQIKRTGERDKAFAVAGILLFAAWAIVFVFTVVLPLTAAGSGYGVSLVPGGQVARACPTSRRADPGGASRRGVTVGDHGGVRAGVVGRPEVRLGSAGRPGDGVGDRTEPRRVTGGD